MFVYISNQWFKNETIPFTKATENEILKEKFDRKIQDLYTQKIPNTLRESKDLNKWKYIPCLKT